MSWCAFAVTGPVAPGCARGASLSSQFSKAPRKPSSSEIEQQPDQLLRLKHPNKAPDEARARDHPGLGSLADGERPSVKILDHDLFVEWK